MTDPNENYRLRIRHTDDVDFELTFVADRK